MPLLEARDLERSFSAGRWFAAGRRIRAVDGVSLHVARGETLALVGESGCGKSTLGRLLLGLTPASAGQVRFDGRDIAAGTTAQRRALRARMQLVFQNPLAALDPRMTIGRQIAEPLAIHRMGDVDPGIAARRQLAEVGLSPDLAERYPHQISGGQRQRVVIARALVTQPDFVVFDEPVSALDVSIQAQIVAMIRRLQGDRGFASVFISHDLRVVRHVADRLAVMYLGRIVEEGPVADVLAAPAHPYTRALVAAVPRLDPGTPRARGDRLKGEPPRATQIPPGCAFHPRCTAAVADCSRLTPQLRRIGPQRRAACLLVNAPHPTELEAEKRQCVS